MLSSAPDGNDELIAQFLREHAVAPDRAAHLKEWERQQPHLAGELAALANMEDRLHQSRPADEPTPKQLGEFQIVRRLGASMGEVFEAWQPSLSRRVAVKTIRRGRISLHARERFLREQKVLAGLHQTHIVPIHAAGEEAGLQYFVMPYIDGAALHHVVHAASVGSYLKTGKTPPLQELAQKVADSQIVNASPPAKQPETTPYEPAAPVLVKPTAGPLPPLDLNYFRSVAQVMADAADALQFAHDADILHRDIKPSNLMVDRQGHCWIIDFGLAEILKKAEKTDSPAAETVPAPAAESPHIISGVMGTPPYMAPEQWTRHADFRTDVYGLGVTLFELLTLRRAFVGSSNEEIKEKILAADPMKPRKLVPNLPADLDAICRRAMHKAPHKRYPCPSALADDLRRWLADQPTAARPAWWPRRLWMWSKRNKGWAAAILLFMVASITFAGYSAHQREEENRSIRRQMIIQDAQRLRMSSPRRHGWTKETAALVGQAAQVRIDDTLRNEAAGRLVGLDAEQEKVFDFGASGVAFDASGKRLVMGGLKDRGPSLWSEPDAAPTTGRQSGWGPVAFRGETPLHLVVDPENPDQRLLWDVKMNQLLQTLKIPGDSPARPEAKPIMALSADGLMAAAAVERADKSQSLATWDTSSGQLVKMFPTGATVLAFSPDRKLLAAGQQDGTIQVWDLPKGESVATLKLERNSILSLAFGRGTVFYGSGDTPPRWLLAAGEYGGNVTIWDVEKKLPRNFFRGLSGEALALAFTGDGVTLAAATRGRVNLIDVATGRLLLEIRWGNIITGLACSPDGQKLAASYLDPWTEKHGVTVWRIEEGRGIQTLRGLDSSLMQVWFSPDGSLVAGLSYTWKLGIWDQKTGRLQHVIAVPPGVSPDNASLAFHPDGKKIAFAAGRHAGLWNLATGNRIGEPWKLGMGVLDQLVYQPQGKLVLFRVETSDPEVAPFGGTDYKKYPRLCRLWELQEAKPLKEIKAIPTLHRGVVAAALSPNGRYVAVDGFGGPAGADRFIMVFDGLTGAEKWLLPSKYKPPSRTLEFDPTEGLLLVDIEFSRGLALEASTGKTLEEWPRMSCFNTITGYSCVHAGPPGWGCSLYRTTDKKFLVTLGIDVIGGGCHFNRAGTHLAWGNQDGSIFVADIPAVQSKLAAVGLGW